MCLMLLNIKALNSFFVILKYIMKISLVPLLASCSILLLYACSQPEQQSAVLDSEKMTGLLLDLHLAEAYSIGLGDTVENSPHRFDKNYDSLAVFYTSILAHHGTNLKQFKASLNWYRDRPGKMDTLYLNLIEALMAQKSERNIPDMDPSEIPDEAGVHQRPQDLKQELRAIEPDSSAAAGQDSNQ